MSFDPRLTPARPDLAAEHLRGQVTAARFVEGTPGHVSAEVLDMWDTTDRSRGLSSQLLYGEPVTIYDAQAGAGLAWVQCETDGYVGYVPANGVAPGAVSPDHMVLSMGAQLYAAPELKRPPLHMLPFGARLSVHARRDGYADVGGLWCPAQSLGQPGPGDFVAVAERFLGVPYLWGGRSDRGLDCSALVQLSLAAVGAPAPRDSDMQQALGQEVPVADRRGDLVCWRGHIGIMLDARRLLHANAHHMAVTVEPLAEAVARISATDTGPVLTIRRL